MGERARCSSEERSHTDQREPHSAVERWPYQMYLSHQRALVLELCCQTGDWEFDECLEQEFCWVSEKLSSRHEYFLWIPDCASVDWDLWVCSYCSPWSNLQEEMTAKNQPLPLDSLWVCGFWMTYEIVFSFWLLQSILETNHFIATFQVSSTLLLRSPLPFWNQEEEKWQTALPIYCPRQQLQWLYGCPLFPLSPTHHPHKT